MFRELQGNFEKREKSTYKLKKINPNIKYKIYPTEAKIMLAKNIVLPHY